MKTKKFLLLSFGAFLLSVGLGYPTTLLAQSAPTGQPHKKHGFRKFQRGVCVGQTLAQEGIILPPRQPGQRPVWDATTKAAFKAAVQSCRAQSRPVNGNPPTATTGSGTTS